MSVENIMLANQEQESASSTRTKTVRFAGKPVKIVENPLLLSEQDCRDLWYSFHDLSVMRGEHEQEGANNALDDKKNGNSSLDQKESRSSDELCCEESHNRYYHRKLSIQCIRSAYRKGMSQEKVAEISRRCSAGCVKLAALQAIHDYVAVHHSDCPPEIFVDLPPISSIQPTFPFAMRKRRRVTQQGANHSTSGVAAPLATTNLSLWFFTTHHSYGCSG